MFLWFDALTRGDVALVGGKNSSLGEMVQRLTSKGVRTPEGFATTAGAYRAYVDALAAHARYDAIRQLRSFAASKRVIVARREGGPLRLYRRSKGRFVSHQIAARSSSTGTSQSMSSVRDAITDRSHPKY
jgi:phosphoenolpyruvate synthase/pyruvate phosphate dikinase